MTRRRRGKSSVSSSLDINDIINELDNGSELLSESKVLTSRDRVPTPVEVFNCILGGGIPYGSAVGVYGPPAGGKSTISFLTAAEFLRNEPNGFLAIVDVEGSADPNRLESLGVDISRTIRMRPTSIMDGFDKVISLLDHLYKKIEVTGINTPVFVVWDTISKGRSEDGEESSRMDARNRARVIKSRMSDLLPWTEKLDVVLFLLNQVVITTDMYGNSRDDAGGGVGLSHDEHVRIYVRKGARSTSQYDKELGMMAQEMSLLSLDKSKISPRIEGIPIILDVTKGGTVDQEESFFRYLYDKSLLDQSGGWYNLNSLIERSQPYPYGKYFRDTYSGNVRYADMVSRSKEDPILFNLLRLALIDIVGSRYALQEIVMKDYREEIVQELIELNPETYVIPIETKSDNEEVSDTDTESNGEEDAN